MRGAVVPWKDVEAQAAFWDAQAASFDEEPDHGLRDPVTRAAWGNLLAELLPAPRLRVVDVGCGTGTLSVLLAQQGHAVTGLDLSPKMIELARQKAQAAAVPVAFAVGNASAPDLPGRTFDVVLSRHVLWAVPDAAEALGRWIKLLNHGGQLVLIEGRWATGAGLTAAETMNLVRMHGREAEVRYLTDPAYWGGPIPDERYVVISHPPNPSPAR